MVKNSCQKKPKFSEILGTKVVQFWCYTKLVKTKNVPLNWYFSTKNFFRKIGVIFDVENSLWKSDFGTFWRDVSHFIVFTKYSGFVWACWFFANISCFSGPRQLVFQIVCIRYYTLAAWQLAVYHCHKPDLLHKWPLLQVCYRS